MKQDTITAIATPIGSGGIGIIRISGADSLSILQKIFRKKVNKKGAALEKHVPRQLTHGFIIDSEKGGVIDEVLAVFMQAPHSYTCEDVVEIQSHCGPLILTKILALVIEHGARLAEPGEFTRRAFLNGRIDLTQAESVADMIHARTESALAIASRQLNGEMGFVISQLIDNITKNIVLLQAGIEFENEVHTTVDWAHFLSDIETAAINTIEGLLADYKSNHVLRDGLRLNIIGRPNVGKSSLLNRVLRKEKAIVTPIPGTTRDLIEDYFSIRGIPILITDTAGWHNTDDPVECLGIEKTRQAITQSDIILFVIDATEPFVEDDLQILNNVDIKKTILVINKIDLLELPFNGGIPKTLQQSHRVEISAKTGHGIETLKDVIADHALGGSATHNVGTLVPSMRQKTLLETVLKALQQAVKGVHTKITDELIVYELEEALEALRRIRGEVVDDQVMDEIFNRFCIGK